MAKLPGFFEGTETPTAGWWEALWPDPANVVNAVGIRAGMTVVDLCCGDGWFTSKLPSRPTASLGSNRASVADVARLRLAESEVTNCEFIEGDAYDLANLISGPVDFVFLANAFHGVPDKPRLARAVAAALVPGGRFAVVNWHRRAREETMVLGEPRGPRTELRISPEQTIAAIEGAELKRSRIVELPPYHYGAVFERTSTEQHD